MEYTMFESRIFMVNTKSRYHTLTNNSIRYYFLKLTISCKGEALENKHKYMYMQH